MAQNTCNNLNRYLAVRLKVCMWNYREIYIFVCIYVFVFVMSKAKCVKFGSRLLAKANKNDDCVGVPKNIPVYLIDRIRMTLALSRTAAFAEN